MNSFLFLHLLYIGLFLFSNEGIVDSILMNWLDFFLAIHLCQVSGFNLWLRAFGILFLLIVIHLSSPEPVLSGVIECMERLQAWKLQYPLGTLIYSSLPRSRFCPVKRRPSQSFLGISVAWRDRLRAINFLSGFSLHAKPIRVCCQG